MMLMLLMMMMRWPMASGFVISSQHWARSPSTQRSFFECCLERVRSRFGTTWWLWWKGGKGEGISSGRVSESIWYVLNGEWMKIMWFIPNKKLFLWRLLLATQYFFPRFQHDQVVVGAWIMSHFVLPLQGVHSGTQIHKFLRMTWGFLQPLGQLKITHWHGPMTQRDCSRQSVALIPGMLWTASCHANGGWNCPWGSHKCVWGGRSLGPKCWGKWSWMLNCWWHLKPGIKLINTSYNFKWLDVKSLTSLTMLMSSESIHSFWHCSIEPQYV